MTFMFVLQLHWYRYIFISNMPKIILVHQEGIYAEIFLVHFIIYIFIYNMFILLLIKLLILWYITDTTWSIVHIYCVST